MEKAGENFLKREYEEAKKIFESVLRIDPTHKEARLGTILCDMVHEDEEEAIALYDYYIVLKEEAVQNPEDQILAMIKELDLDQEELNKLFEFDTLPQMEGITYKDFLSIVESRGNFKEAFEDIMFSTKVIITKKSDFFDFIDRLIENGFTDIVYSYLEDATKLYPADQKLQEFFERLTKV